MTVASAFYLLTALVVVGALPWQTAAASSSPLAAAMESMLRLLHGPAGAGIALMSVGAMVSIAGVYDAFTLGVSRLSFALAADGLFPAPFARLHPRFGTPWVGLAFQAATAIAAVTLFDLRGLITASVVFLSVAYLLTALAAMRLVRVHPDRALRMPGLRAALVLSAISALYLASQAPLRDAAIAAAAIGAGLALYYLRRRHWHLAAAGHPRRALADQGTHTYHWLRRSALRLAALVAAGRRGFSRG